MKIHSSTKIAVFVALGIVLQIVDNMIALPIAIPGGKVGLANIVSICALIVFPVPIAFAISVVRALLGGLLFGGVMAAAYSVIGAVFSMIVMSLIKPNKLISYIGIGILGAVAHNVGQIMLACLLLRSMAAFAYLPTLLVISAFSGALVGFLGKEFARFESYFSVGLAKKK